MKKIISVILAGIVMLACLVLSVSASVPQYQTVCANTVEELIEWIETEDLDYYQAGRYQKGITTLLEKGELMASSFLQEAGLELTYIEALPDEVKGGIMYHYVDHDRTASCTVTVRPVDPNLAYLLEESLSAYLEAFIGAEFKDLPVYETTIGGEQSEKISYVTAEYEMIKNLHFIKDGWEVRIGQNPSQWNMEYVNQLQLIKIPVSQKATAAGSGDTLITRNRIENSFYFHRSVAQEDMNTESLLRKYAQTVILNGAQPYEAAWEIINEFFQPAVTGTEKQPEGVNGSYTFQVKVNRGDGREAVTRPITIAVEAISYVGDFPQVADLVPAEENQVTAELVQCENKNIILAVACYQGKKAIKIMIKPVAENGKITVEIAENADTVKAFLWKDFISLQPLGKPKTLTRNGDGQWQ